MACLSLLLDGAGNGTGDFMDFVNGAVNAPQRLDRGAGGLLDGSDLVADLARCPNGLIGQVLHFLRDHGEALAGLAGPGGLDGGV